MLGLVLNLPKVAFGLTGIGTAIIAADIGLGSLRAGNFDSLSGQFLRWTWDGVQERQIPSSVKTDTVSISKPKPLEASLVRGVAKLIHRILNRSTSTGGSIPPNGPNRKPWLLLGGGATGLVTLGILIKLFFSNPQSVEIVNSLTDDELDDLMNALANGRGGLPIPTLKTPDGKNFEEAKDFNLEIGKVNKKQVTVKINTRGEYERIDGVNELDDDELDDLMDALSNGRGGLPIPTLKTPDGKNFEEAKDFNLEIGKVNKKKVTVKINTRGEYERIDFTKESK